MFLLNVILKLLNFQAISFKFNSTLQVVVLLSLLLYDY